MAAMFANMREVKIDCSGVTSPDELWQRYIDAAKPSGASMFGRNLDAFWDAIEGGGPGWPGNVVLVFEHSRQLSAFTTVGGQRSYLDALTEIADQASIVAVKLI